LTFAFSYILPLPKGGGGLRRGIPQNPPPPRGRGREFLIIVKSIVNNVVKLYKENTLWEEGFLSFLFKISCWLKGTKISP